MIAESEIVTDAVATTTEPVTDVEAPWQRLHFRMIWVDALQSLLSITPGALAIWVFGVEPELGNLWPFLAVAVFGVIGAVSDALRWVFTRYRVSEKYVERRTGLFVRQYRTVRRDRIRSVDIDARLRHRLAGLRVVQIGAGQQSAAGESAFDLNAVRTADAETLQHTLMRRPSRAAGGALLDAPDAESSTGGDQHSSGAGEHSATEPGQLASLPGAAGGEDEPAIEEVQTQVLARLRPGWVVYNLFNVWALVLAIGLGWGGFWLAATFNIDAAAFVLGLLDWQGLSWGSRIAIGTAAVVVVGVIGMAVTFFTSHWNFELSRRRDGEQTTLSTRQGLFRTREVNRDQARMRGIQIAEPVLWRWLGVTDTTVITTGLDAWASSDPTTILPRGPRVEAMRVAAEVLGTAPLRTPLRPHPPAALRRRIWWATVVTALVVGILTWLALTDVVPLDTIWIGIALWPLTLLAAFVAYRALGHAIYGDYVVLRSGLSSRATTALQRSAVSTIAVRESLLQRRLGLRSVSAMTAAGDGVYEAPDVPAEEAVALADRAAPGLLEPFLLRTSGQGQSSPRDHSPSAAV